MKRRCRNCRGPLAEYQRFFCSDLCRNEFGQRGQRSRPQPKSCRNCGRPLTGKQRKWCSDACRKRTARRRKKASGFKPPASGNVRESNPLAGYVGKKSFGVLQVIIEVEQVQPYLDPYNAVNHLRSEPLRAKYAELLEEIMQQAVYGHRVVVKIRLL